MTEIKNETNIQSTRFICTSYLEMSYYLGPIRKGMTILVILKGALIVSYREHKKDGNIEINKQSIYF